MADAKNEATGQALGAEAGSGAEGSGLGFVIDVPLRLSVEIGGARLLVRDVLQLGEGSVVELDRMSGDPADVFVNGRLVAKGEVTVVEERMAIRIVELISPEGSGEPVA